MARRDRDFSFSIDGEQGQKRRSYARSGQERWKRPSERPPGKVVRDLLLGAVLSLVARSVIVETFGPTDESAKPSLFELDLGDSGIQVLATMKGSTTVSGPGSITFQVPDRMCQPDDVSCVANLFRKFDWTTRVDDLDGVEPGLEIEMMQGSSMRCVGIAQLKPADVAWPSMYGIPDNQEMIGRAFWYFSYWCSE